MNNDVLVHCTLYLKLGFITDFKKGRVLACKSHF